MANKDIWVGQGADILSLSNQADKKIIGYNLPSYFRSSLPVDYSIDMSKAIADFANQQVRAKGVFSTVTPGNLLINQDKESTDGFYRFTNYQVNLVSYDIGERDLNLYYQDDLNDFLTSYNQGMALAHDAKRHIIDLSSQVDSKTLILQAPSNLDLKLGNGDNVILTSPMMTSYINSYTSLPSGGYNPPTKTYANIFFPSSQGLRGSNTLTLGDGNNLVYFDSSYQKIVAGKGDNIFLPSYGSFNWAANDIHFGSKATTDVNNYNNPLPSSRTLLAPVAVSSDAYSREDLFTFVFNGNRNAQGKSEENAFQIYKGNEPNLLNYSGNLTGGVRIEAGSGNDVFYGFDPSFYEGITPRNINNAGKNYATDRDVFNTPKGNVENERFNDQFYQTIEFLGGRGNNVFYLGNPAHITPEGSKFIGNYAYRISVAHNKFASTTEQSKLNYGAELNSSNIINVNVSANVKSYDVSSMSYEPEEGEHSEPLEISKASVEIADEGLKIFKALKEEAAHAAKWFPYAEAISSAITIGFSIYDIIKASGVKPDPAPIKLSEEFLAQPLGSWKKAVNINDWNPGTVLNIKVDPAIADAAAAFRWNNVRFTINPPDTNSDSMQGVTISVEQGADGKSDLFRLDGFAAAQSGSEPLYGYYAYDFHTGKNRLVTEKDLSFLGIIAHGVEGINPLKNYQASNGFVFSSDASQTESAFGTRGTYSFYWNDPGFNAVTGQENGAAWLYNARNAASNISIQFDSKKFGWFWQPEFMNSPNGSVSIDQNASKLWVELQPGDWTPFTFKQLDDNPTAYSYALKAKTFYQTNYGGRPLVSMDQKFTQKQADSLALLGDVVDGFQTSLGAQLTQYTNLAIVSQVTFAERGEYNASGTSLSGVWIYYTFEDQDPTNSNVYKTFIYKDAARPDKALIAVPASDDWKKAMQKNEVYAKELQASMDINVDGIVGPPAVSQLVKPPNLIADFPHQGDERAVRLYYQSILGREPDAEGLNQWMAALNSNHLKVADVLKHFLSSEEFMAKSSSVNGFVSHMYRHLLGRDADQGGHEAWVNYMEIGGSPAQVIEGFYQSREFIDLIGNNSRSNGELGLSLL